MSESVMFSINQPMISASHEASKHRYHVHQGKGRRWLVADLPAAADHVYAEGGKGSQGMAGRTLRFDLVDGTYLELIGPWKGSAEHMFQETGVDVRDKYTQQGIIALDVERGEWWKDTYSRILHHDKAPTVGAFHRIERMAQDYADKLGVPVHMAVMTFGGGHARTVYPTKKEG